MISILEIYEYEIKISDVYFELPEKKFEMSEYQLGKHEYEIGIYENNFEKDEIKMVMV